MSDAKLHVMDHPLILHKISMLRSKDTSTKDFRQLIHEIALLIGYEATRDLPVTEFPVTTLRRQIRKRMLTSARAAAPPSGKSAVLVLSLDFLCGMQYIIKIPPLYDKRTATE